MSEIEVKHYKRLHKGEREKGLVTERVTADSETALFLQELEAKRRTRACQLTIDMRGKVPGECRGYLINNKVFYLDDISLAILNKGLKENYRQFTVETYEAIVNGAHTNRAIRLEQQRKSEISGQPVTRSSGNGSVPGNGSDVETAESSASKNQGPRYCPEVLLSGYYKKRRQERIQYVTGVTLVIDGRSYSAKTRDLSLSGIQVYLKGAYKFQEGQSLRLSFMDVQEAFGIDGLKDMPYKIINVADKSIEVTLRLVRTPDPQEAALSSQMQQLVGRLSKKYKCDVEDDLLSVNACIHERLYTDNVTHIPLFYSRDAAGNVHLKRVGVTDRNQSLMDFFTSGKRGCDFSALALPNRIAHLLGADSTAAGGSRELLLVLYRNDNEDGAIHSATDIEIGDAVSLRAFMRHAMVHEHYRMLKISVINMRKPSEEKIALRARRLLDKSAQDMALIKEDFDALFGFGMAVDVTDEIVRGIRLLDQKAVTLDGVYVLKGLSDWVGSERKAPDTGATLEKLSAPVDVRPDTVKFGYLERRREERYQLQTQIDIAIKGGQLKGVTQDISVRGLQAVIAMDNIPELQIGDIVKVHYVGLQSKVGGSVKLDNIEYRVANIVSGKKVRLMLERVIKREQEELNTFFVDLINRNRHKLPVDIEETLYAARSRVHESILADNLINIPFFMAKDDEGSIIIQKIALNDEPCRLSDFFRLPDGSYDFSPLIETKRVYYLHDGLSLIARKESIDGRAEDSIEAYIYMYREPAQPGRPSVLRSLANYEMSEDVTREQFLREAIKSGDYCFIKISATPISEMHNIEVDAVIDGIRENSRHRAAKLKEGFQRIVAQGELIDVTAQVLATIEM